MVSKVKGNGAAAVNRLPAEERATISIPALAIKLLKIKIVGDTPLVVHRFAEKAKQEMRDKQGKKAKAPREAKDPERCFRDALYELPQKKGYGFPAICFKRCAVGAAQFIPDLTYGYVKGAFFVMDDADGLVKLEGSEPRMVEHIVKVGPSKVADLRYRPMFDKWAVTLRIRYDSGILSAEQIVNLFNRAGFSIGVGEGRPEKKEMGWGQFHVESVEG